MATPQEQLARLRRYNLTVRENDPKLAEEMRDRGFEAMVTEAVSPQAAEEMLGLESIVMRTQRPVLAIRDNVTRLVFIDEADSEIWGERLTKAQAAARRCHPGSRPHRAEGAPARLGRHRLARRREHHRDQPPRGARVRGAQGERLHLQDGPARADGRGRRLPPGDRQSRTSSSSSSSGRCTSRRPPGPDVAFFEIEMVSGDAQAGEADRARDAASRRRGNVATIGYPAYDSRIPEPDLMERIYGKIYNKKRLAPGGVTRVEQTRSLAQLHDAGRQFRLGRVRPRQRPGARPAFQRQLPRHELRGARRRGEEAARRRARRPRAAARSSAARARCRAATRARRRRPRPSAPAARRRRRAA